jgi:hypothetical protein
MPHPVRLENRKSLDRLQREVEIPKGIIDRIGPIDFPEENGLRMLLYGKSGTGKTTFWATFPGPILCIVCSGGSCPGELRSINTEAYRAKISQVVLRGTEELRPLLEYLRSTKKYRTTVLDHASGFQDLTLKEILDLDELPAQKKWGMATQQQYGTSATMCKEAFRGLLSLPGNVVIVAQEREFTVEGASDLIAPTVGAALTPSVTGWLGPACDYVVQTYLRSKSLSVEAKVGEKKVVVKKRGEGVEYCLRTEPHEVFQTKFRLPKGHPLPECIVDPSYDKVLKIIRGE